MFGYHKTKIRKPSVDPPGLALLKVEIAPLESWNFMKRLKVPPPENLLNLSLPVTGLMYC